MLLIMLVLLWLLDIPASSIVNKLNIMSYIYIALLRRCSHCNDCMFNCSQSVRDPACGAEDNIAARTKGSGQYCT